MRVIPRPPLMLSAAMLCGVVHLAPLAVQAQASATNGAAGSAGAKARAGTDSAMHSLQAAIVTAEGTPLGGASVRLAIERAPNQLLAESDDNGHLVFPNAPAGRGWLHARRIGFRPDSVPVTVLPVGTPQVTLRLTRVAVELAAVRVLGRRDLNGPMGGFFRRQQTNGGGRFFTAQDLERRNAMHMTDVFRSVPGIRIESFGPINRVRVRNSVCAPLVWLDGQPLYAGEVDLDNFDPRTFDGIEVYSGPATVPVEFQGNEHMSSSCGTIVLWSKHGEARPPKRKQDAPTPVALVMTLIDKGEAFLSTDVDVAARPDSSELVRPVYPDSLFEEQTPGRVLAEFVVNAKGRAMMETFSAVTASHRHFVEPVRRAVQQQEFTPATRGGKVVQQVMQLPFVFVPDSTARRRR